MIDISDMLTYNRRVGGSRRGAGRGGARPGAGRKRIVQNPARIAVDFEEEQMDVLKELAKRRGTSIASLIRAAVAQYLRRSTRR